MFCGLLGGKEVEMVKRRKVEWGKSGGFCSEHNRLARTRTEKQAMIKEQWSVGDLNATALSIYRGVTYTNTMDEEGKSNTVPFLNPKKY